MSHGASVLCFAGVLLFLMGLLTGFAIPVLKSPRLGLSAHLTAVQSGIALIAFGFLWQHLSFWNGWSAPLAHALWVGLYLLSLGMLLAAIWGTGRMLPIAGAGFESTKWQEQIARLPLAIGSFATLVAVALILMQWRWDP